MRDVRPADQDVYDLPFDPVTRTIVCRRETWTEDVPGYGTAERTRLHYNIERRHVDHSPSGWEWGYGGSGPSDFSLNVLALFIPPAPDPGPEPDESAPPEAWEAWADANDQNVKLWDGSHVHADVWRLHHDFKVQFVAALPHEGGSIPGIVIEAWITAHQHARDTADLQES